jgi:hypothetical protein
MEVRKMDDFKKFMTNYWGALFGGIIALIIACID